jgi:hypothetical protein
MNVLVQIYLIATVFIVAPGVCKNAVESIDSYC